jgi:hypothetical protein
MPKDNEVDEKVKPVAWVERTEGGLTRMWSGDLSAWAHRPANPEPLYSAATVAELRAEVERLRKSNELYSFAMNTAGIDELKRRADAAERRVAALQECAVRYLKWLRVSKPEAALEHDLHDAGMCGDKALTGADPT